MNRSALWMSVVVLVSLTSVCPTLGQTPMGTGFTYQGQLKLAGEAVDGSADFEFRLSDAPSGGNELGMVPFNNVTVADGLFTAVLDFGISPFAGEARWLEIDVRSPSGSGDFTTLSPRQELTPTVYALYAETAGTAPGGVTGSGTLDCIPKFTGASAIGDSVLYEVNGYVGVGTTAPEYKLHVEGQTDARLYLRNTGEVWTGVVFDVNHSLADRSIGVLRGLWAGERVADIVINTGDDATDKDGGRIRFLTKDSGQTIADRLRIEPNGYVGIGSGIPEDKLEVRGGTARVTSTIPTLRFNETDTSDENWQIRANGGKLLFQSESDDFTNPLNRVAFLQDGKVGIGTNNPGTLLDVVGTARMEGFELPTGAADGLVLMSDATGTGTWQPVPGDLSGSGTAGRIAKFTDSDVIGDSVITESSGSIHVDGPVAAHGTVTATKAWNSTGPGLKVSRQIAPMDNVWTEIDGSNVNSYNDRDWPLDVQNLYLNGDSPGDVSIAAGGGDVGIGLAYPNYPTAKLDVDGMVRSRSGGFKFPDGTVQTTAAGISFWAGTGGDIYNTNPGNVGVGASPTPNAKLDVVAETLYAGRFTSDNPSSDTHVIHAEYTAGGYSNASAVYGRSVPVEGHGVGGTFVGGLDGVQGKVTPTGSEWYTGVRGSVSGGSGTNFGVFGFAHGAGTNYGVYGEASGVGTNYAGYFFGNVNVTGTLSKAGGSFKIDHPLDPENKFLYHSFVESPDMMNVYNGNVVTGADGQTWIELPEWFEALNRDVRYQLTVIGEFAQAIVADEVRDNRFLIRTDKPNVKVSWQVTGIRQDAFANANRIPVEQDKSEDQRGRYLHPKAFGVSTQLGIYPVDEAAAAEKAASIEAAADNYGD